MPALPFRRVAIVGVGLIGGSIGLALRRRTRGPRVIGIDRAAVLRRALRRGAVHEGRTSLTRGLRGCDLIVLALPVDGIIDILPRLRRHADAAAIVTDVGSTKAMVLAAAARHGLRDRFVGGHPMAGSERSGVGHADADLFRGARWVLCPLGRAPVAVARRLASAVGARPVVLPARRHDEIMAGLSHLPQLLSVAMVNAAAAGRGGGSLRLAGPGFRQMARLASSSARLWHGILRTNATAVRRALGRLRRELRLLDRSLEAGCATRFRRAARLRAAMNRSPRRRARAGVGAALLTAALVAWGGAAAARPPVAEPGSGRLLVADAVDGLLRIYELPSRALLGTLKVGSSPVAVAAARDGRTAWVADRDEATLTVVDLVSLRVARTLPVEGIDRPCSLAGGDDGRWLLIGGETGRRLVQLDAARSVVTRAMTTTEAGPHRVAAARRGSRAFVANQAAASVTAMSTESLRIGEHWPIGAPPGALAVAPDGSRLLVTLPERRAVIVLNGGGRELGRLALPGEPRGVTILPSGARALIAVGAPAGVVSIDLRALQAGELRPLDGSPDAIVTDDAGARAYVTGSGWSAVRILSIAQNEVIGEIETGHGSSALAWARVPAPPPDKRKR